MVSKESAAKRLGKAASLTSRRKGAKATMLLPASTDEHVQVELATERHRRPKDISHESSQERKARLAARKARTLKAFQTTYENRRKAS
jgi:hypothetical protein